MIRRRNLVAVLAVSGLWPRLVVARPATGAVAVQVVDTRGTRLAGAGVRIAGTGPERASETDRAGVARFADVSPGFYTVAVRSKGLAPDSLPVVTVQAGRTARVRINMHLDYYPPDGDMPRIPQP